MYTKVFRIISTAHFTAFIERVCGSSHSIDDIDSLLDEIEAAINILNHVVSGESRNQYHCSELVRLRTRLLSIFERWSCQLSRRSDCSIVAVGVAGASEARHSVATVGRPKVAIKVDFVELLHSSGFNMKEIAAALLISRTTL